MACCYDADEENVDGHGDEQHLGQQENLSQSEYNSNNNLNTITSTNNSEFNTDNALFLLGPRYHSLANQSSFLSESQPSLELDIKTAASVASNKTVTLVAPPAGQFPPLVSPLPTIVAHTQ
jgi:hypothetical protein